MDTEGSWTPPPEDLLITLVAEAGAVSLVRDRLRSWLTALWWPDGELDDVVLAVNEAVTNVVDHAYRHHPAHGDVTVFGWIARSATGRRVGLSVIDHGRWRPIPRNPGYRGRGLLMMKACTDMLYIEHSAAGTAVTMLSNTVPDIPRPTSRKRVPSDVTEAPG